MFRIFCEHTALGVSLEVLFHAFGNSLMQIKHRGATTGSKGGHPTAVSTLSH